MVTIVYTGLSLVLLNDPPCQKSAMKSCFSQSFDISVPVEFFPRGVIFFSSLGNCSKG